MKVTRDDYEFLSKPSVVMVIGVNGVGKTTTIGKLAWQFKEAGKKVVLGAADTFRAAAVEQLCIWGERVGVPVVKQAMGSDPASSLAITKLDGTAKGGVVIGISDQLKVPVKFVGLGEGMKDLQLFNRREFVDSLFGNDK